MGLLKKEHAVPGAKVIVNDVIRDGVPKAFSTPGHDDVKSHLSVTATAGGAFGMGWSIGSGTILEIVKKPRKVGNINSVRVRVVDAPSIEGEVYWCELRASTTLLVDDNL